MKKEERDEAKLVEQKKKEHLEWFRALQEKEIQNCPWPCTYVNNMGVILTCNSMFADLFNYDKRELLDSNVSMLTPAIIRKDHNSYVAEFFKMAELDSSRHLEVRGVSSKGTLINVAINLTLKKQDISGNIQHFAICQMNLESTEDKYKALYLTTENSREHIYWKLFLSLLLVVTFMLLPVMCVTYNLEATSFLHVVRVFLFVDVIVNLNTSIEINDELSMDRTEILVHYGKRLLLLDVVSCFPFTAVTDLGDPNLNSLFNLAILCKACSLTEYTHRLVDTHNMNKQNRKLFVEYKYYIEYYFYNVVILLLGFFGVNMLCGLFVNMLYSFETSHASASNWVSHTALFDELYTLYVKDYADSDSIHNFRALLQLHKSEVNFEVWGICLTEIIESFLLVQGLSVYNNTERKFELLIKFCGLSFYIVLIGSLTKSSLYYQHYMYDYKRKKNVIDKIVAEQNINMDLIESVYEDFEKNYVDMRFEDISALKDEINYNNYEQIFLSKHKKIIKCDIFNKFTFDSIIQLSNCIRFTDDFIVWTKKELFDAIYFIETGVFKIQNETMEVITEYFEKELVLYEIFVKFIENYELLSVKGSIVNKEASTNEEKDNNSKSHRFSRRSSVDSSHLSSNNNNGPNKPISYSDNCYSYNSTYIIIEAYGLYQLMKEDPKVRTLVEAYYKKQTSKCDQQSIDYTKSELLNFDNKATPALICLSNGEIIHINDILKSSIGGFIKVGEHISLLLQRVDGHNIKKINNIESGKIIMNVDGVAYNCFVSIEVKSLVVTKSRVRNTQTIEYLGVDDNFILSFKSDTNVFKNNRLKVVQEITKSSFTFFIKEKKIRNRASILRSVIMESDINDKMTDNLNSNFLTNGVDEDQEKVKDQIREYIALNLNAVNTDHLKEDKIVTSNKNKNKNRSKTPNPIKKSLKTKLNSIKDKNLNKNIEVVKDKDKDKNEKIVYNSDLSKTSLSNKKTNKKTIKIKKTNQNQNDLNNLDKKIKEKVSSKQKQDESSIVDSIDMFSDN